MIGNKWERVCVGGEGRKEEMSKSEREKCFKKAKSKRERDRDKHTRE